jgi:hypothetical protein
MLAFAKPTGNTPQRCLQTPKFALIRCFGACPARMLRRADLSGSILHSSTVS